MEAQSEVNSGDGNSFKDKRPRAGIYITPDIICSLMSQFLTNMW